MNEIPIKGQPAKGCGTAFITEPVKTYQVKTEDRREGNGLIHLGYARGKAADVKKHFDNQKYLSLRLEEITVEELD